MADPFPLPLSRTTPRVSSTAIARDRLTHALLPLAPLTIIRAPGGAGKTVLATQLVERLPEANGAWVTVEEDIAGREPFWRHVVSQLLGPERASMWFGVGALFSRRMLIAALRSVGTDCVVVVDDAHLFDEVAVQEDLLLAAKTVPSVRFVISTRVRLTLLEDPAIELDVDVKKIGPDDLGFSREEVSTFLRDSSLSADMVFEASGGNALMMRAIALSREGRPDQKDVNAGVSAAYLRRYLSSLGDARRAFLQRTSLGADFTLEEATALVGPGDHASSIAQLEVAGLIVRSSDGSRERYRYHPIVREILRHELEHDYPGDTRQLHSIVARHRFDGGEFAAAFHHALCAREYALATDAFVRGGLTILQQGTGDTVVQLPLAVALHYPLLATARALVENARGRRWIAREYFAAAMAAKRSGSKRSTPERACVAVAESGSARLRGDRNGAAAAARKAVDLIDQVGSDAFGEQIGELLATCAVSFFRAGASDELAEVLVRLPISSPRGGMMRASVEAAGAAARGDWALVSEIEDAVVAAGWPQGAVDGYHGALLRLARMLRDLSRGDWASARGRVDYAGQEMQRSEFRVLLAAAEALADTLSGAPARAMQKLSRMREAERATRRLSDADARMLALSEALALIAADDSKEASRVLDALPANDPLAALVRAHLLLLQQDHVTAGRVLSAPALAATAVPRLKRARDLLTAWRALNAGDLAEARSATERAVKVTMVHGEDGGLMLLPAEVRHRLVMLFGQGDDAGEAEAIRQLSAPLPSPFELRERGPRLTAREMVVLRELRHGASNAQMASSLNISRNTLKTQLRSAYRKLGVTDREEALALASALGLIDEGDEASGHADAM